MSEHVKRYRYRVGCPGMFVLGQDYPVATEDEAIVACASPPGCEVLDTLTGKWFAPECMEEIEEAKRRLAAPPSTRAHGKRHG